MVVGLLAFAPAQAATPSNDAFASAMEVTLPYEASVDVSEATAEFGEPRCSFREYDTYSSVWYRVTATDTRPMAATLFSSQIPTHISVHYGPSMKELRYVGCDARQPGYVSRVGWVPAVGETYYIRIGGHDRSRGVLDLKVINPAPPPNDERQNAMPITYAEPMEFEHLSMENIAAGTTGEPKPSCVSSLSNAYSIWYQLTTPAAVSRDFVFHSITYGSYARVAGWEVQGDGSLVELGCADNLPSRISPKPNTTYLFQVIGFFSYSGPFGIHLHPAVSNDHFSEAMSIDALPFQHSAEAYNATLEPGERPVRCEDYGTESSIWYRYTSTTDAVLRFKGEGGTTSAYPVPVAAYKVTGGGLSELGCAIGTGYSEVRTGETVYFQVSPQYLSATFVTFTVEAVPPSPNDSPQSPTNIPDLGVFNSTANFTTRAARLSQGEPAPSCAETDPGGTAWFSFTPTVPGPITVDVTYAGFDGVLAVHDRSLNEIACNDDAGPSFSALGFDAALGETYLLSISGNARGRGTGSLQLRHGAAPPNDAFANAIRIESLPSTHMVSPGFATTEPNEPRPAPECLTSSATGIHSTVWYRYTPTADMQLTAALAATDINVLVTVFTGTGLSDLTQVACTLNTAVANLRTFRLPATFSAEAGTTYYFQLGRQTRSTAITPVSFTLSGAENTP